MTLKLSDQDIQRFWSKVDRQPSHHLWTDRLTPTGYGQIKIQGRKYLIHRVVWYIAYGTWPRNALHVVDCRFRHCIRLEHLYDGTRSENALDSVEVRTHNNVKLTDSDVRDIRLLSQHGLTDKTIAETYGISRANVYQIVNHKTWK